MTRPDERGEDFSSSFLTFKGDPREEIAFLPELD
jgi:hypothetical protein